MNNPFIGNFYTESTTHLYFDDHNYYYKFQVLHKISEVMTENPKFLILRVSLFIERGPEFRRFTVLP